MSDLENNSQDPKPNSVPDELITAEKTNTEETVSKVAQKDDTKTSSNPIDPKIMKIITVVGLVLILIVISFWYIFGRSANQGNSLSSSQNSVIAVGDAITYNLEKCGLNAKYPSIIDGNDVVVANPTTLLYFTFLNTDEAKPFLETIQKTGSQYSIQVQPKNVANPLASFNKLYSSVNLICLQEQSLNQMYDAFKSGNDKRLEEFKQNLEKSMQEQNKTSSSSSTVKLTKEQIESIVKSHKENTRFTDASKEELIKLTNWSIVKEDIKNVKAIHQLASFGKQNHIYFFTLNGKGYVISFDVQDENSRKQIQENYKNAGQNPDQFLANGIFASQLDFTKI